jgi:predicted nuclease with TOPRIM domain
LELQRRIEQESLRVSEITGGVKDLEIKIRLREEQILSMRKELEGARYSNSTLLDNNSNLQAEIDALNNHIRVLQINNEDLTKELDEFVQANELIRQRLDRRTRVVELRNKNEVQIQKSLVYVQEARSPPRQR